MTSRLRVLSIFIVFAAGIALLHFSGPTGCSKNCGNGALDAGEACDDGNTADGDGCSSACEIESGGTTGGGTTGGTATGGTTGGSASGECSTPADCPASFSTAPFCEDAKHCQGSRIDATCVDGVCGSVQVPDDSACTAVSFTLDCPPGPSLSCDGSEAQPELACPVEICNDLTDNDYDTLIDCADTVDCPNGTSCQTAIHNPGTCSAGACFD